MKELAPWIDQIFDSSSDKLIFGTTFSQLEKEKCVKLAQLEQGTVEWMGQRSASRITASRAHSILHARTKQTMLNYFFDERKPSDPQCGIANCMYGIAMEPVARDCFISQTGQDVQEVGLIVRPDQSFLAGSPDGLFLDSQQRLRVLEIKCPSSCKDNYIKVPYLKEDGLSKSHSYYTQIQILMYVTGSRLCDLFVFSSKDNVTVTVPIDETFLERTITDLGNIYYFDIWPEILKRAENE